MTLRLEHHVHAKTNCDCVIHRRDFLRLTAAAGLTGGVMSWTDAIRLSADELRQRGMACILLWMAGGPSQFETFSPKPGHEFGGETKSIPTSVTGIHISENMPQCAQVMNDLAVIRSMTSKEGSHPRASFLLHHGYLPAGGVDFPTLGSQVVHQIGDPSFDLPSFVRIGNRMPEAGGAGMLGVDYDPLVLQNPGNRPPNTNPLTGRDRFSRRLQLLNDLESDFGAVEGTDLVADHRKLLRRASDMVLSPRMEAFDVERETPAMRDAYGRSRFGTGCLLARRLVEAGVTFVEVMANGWDTHEDNFARSRLLGEEVDRPTAQLIADLRQRGMLDSTLIIWMGEFGRTPQINARSGRDHYPRAFNVALAGGGIRGGQVVGQTDAGGVEVTDRPVTVNDLFRTVYTTLGIDPDAENYSLAGRPIKLVDGGEVIRELVD